MKKRTPFVFLFLDEIEHSRKTAYYLVAASFGVIALLLSFYLVQKAGYFHLLTNATLDNWLGTKLDKSPLGSWLNTAINQLTHDKYQYQFSTLEGVCSLLVLVGLLRSLNLVLVVWLCFFAWKAYKALRALAVTKAPGFTC